ncbi:hypothetical protein J7438_27050, partial [Thalassotalea sp. G20_0]|uniref:hypothetical protein n=1 Tax=Thalassotalea sp. G20_0 TaxID=2821093 RepID=UPI001AD95F58
GGGRVDGRVTDTTAVNSYVTTKGRFAQGSIGGGVNKGTVANTTAVNSYVNGNIKNFGSTSNDQLLCQKADPRVLTASCSSRTEFLDALDLSYSDVCPILDLSYSDVCPINAAKESTPTTASTAAKESTAAVAANATVSTPTTASTAAPAAATVSTDATASTAATVGGITTGSLMVAGGLGLGIAAYSTYQWITGYQ